MVLQAPESQLLTGPHESGQQSILVSTFWKGLLRGVAIDWVVCKIAKSPEPSTHAPKSLVPVVKVVNIVKHEVDNAPKVAGGLVVA